MSDDEVSPEKKEQPTECCDADSELEVKADRSGNYIIREICTACGRLLRADDNL